MCSYIRYERGLGDYGRSERRFQFFKIRLYDIKNVVLQRRITYIGADPCAAKIFSSMYKPLHILSYCGETVKIISLQQKEDSSARYKKAFGSVQDKIAVQSLPV